MHVSKEVKNLLLRK